jgi:hypothetical protein
LAKSKNACRWERRLAQALKTGALSPADFNSPEATMPFTLNVPTARFRN